MCCLQHNRHHWNQRAIETKSVILIHSTQHILLVLAEVLLLNLVAVFTDVVIFCYLFYRLPCRPIVCFVLCFNTKVVHIHVMTLMSKPKPLCETRWEARVNSIKAIYYQIGEVFDAPIQVAEDNVIKYAKCVTETCALEKEIKSFQFLVTLVIWYDLLMQINLASRIMQTQNVNLDEAVSVLQKTNQFLHNFKGTGLRSLIIAAKELAEELKMKLKEMTFPHFLLAQTWDGNGRKVQFFMKHSMNQTTIPRTVRPIG